MSIPLWAVETAEAFWAEVGGEAGISRVLHGRVQLTLPLSVVLLSDLTLTRLDQWLRQWEIVCSLRGPNRSLRACLVCRAGRGLIFIDKGDSESEKHYSLAHELAHYLREQWQPRRRAAAAFGPQILEVLDGDRPPSAEEAIRSVLAQIPIGLQIHLMERTTEGEYADRSIQRAEAVADLLAFELLAPSEAVLSAMQPYPASKRLEVAHRILVDTYGLPRLPADTYALLLVNDAPDQKPPLLSNFGL